MKWYSHATYKSHLNQLSIINRIDEERAPYIEWPKSMANIFERSYPRIGVLDLTDLMQEGYCSFYRAWNKLDWELINNADEEDRPGIITNYLKLNIKNGIRRAIARDRETIRIPESYYTMKPHGNAHGGKYDEAYQTDIFLTKTFASFFSNYYLDVADEPYGYEQEKLNDLLNEVMNEHLSLVEKQVLCAFFGIDEPYDNKASVNAIAARFHRSAIWVKKIKANALKKMQQPHIKEIIEKYLQN
jgi:DNA-directed RNA polymerase sigma subunit (sigma70/sigma32)